MKNYKIIYLLLIYSFLLFWPKLNLYCKDNTQGGIEYFMIFDIGNSTKSLFKYLKQNNAILTMQSNGCYKLFNNNKNQKIILKYIDEMIIFLNHEVLFILNKKDIAQISITNCMYEYDPKNEKSIKQGKMKGYVKKSRNNSIKKCIELLDIISECNIALNTINSFIPNFLDSKIKNNLDAKKSLIASFIRQKKEFINNNKK